MNQGIIWNNRPKILQQIFNSQKNHHLLIILGNLNKRTFKISSCWLGEVGTRCDWSGSQSGRFNVMVHDTRWSTLDWCLLSNHRLRQKLFFLFWWVSYSLVTESNLNWGTFEVYEIWTNSSLQHVSCHGYTHFNKASVGKAIKHIF